MGKLRVRNLIVLLFVAAIPVIAQEGFKSVESRVVEHTLRNGLKFIILPRHEAPVVSFVTYADVGSVDETWGSTGLAHLFEHMAFKGTNTIGTKDYKKEKVALKKLDQAYLRLREEQRKGDKADSTKSKQLEKGFAAAQEEASKYVVSNEFGTAVEQAGGTGLNASTSWDATNYYFNLPSNKVELWFSLESERFLNPVIRDFYKERDVVMEERRRSIESQPIGKLIEEFLSVAYKAHPYGVSVVGHMSDLQAMTRAQAERFFKSHYVPSNLTIAAVGDVEPKEMIRLAEVYFGRIPAAPKPDPLTTVEPPQRGERRVFLEEQSQRVMLLGYHKGSILHKDDAVFDAITDLMSQGRISRLYRSLVRDKKIATFAGGFSGIPGQKYPGLFLFFAFPSPGHTNEECENAIDSEIVRLKTELVDEATLKAVKTRARANLIRQLNSNQGLALQFTFYQAVTGEWRTLFKQLDAIDAVTAQDIKRVANEYFEKNNRTVAYLEPLKEVKKP